MTVTEPSKPAPSKPSRQALIEAKARAIAEKWERVDDENRLARARRLAARELAVEEEQKARQSPAYCRKVAADRGLRLVADVWGGAPVEPGLVFAPTARWVYDKSGVSVVPADGDVRFVCSPVVALGAGRAWSVKTAAGWETVELRTDRGVRPEQDLSDLVGAGLRIGTGPEVILERGSIDRTAKVAALALGWIFQRGVDGSIFCDADAPVVSLWAGAARVVGLGTMEEKVALSGALTRTRGLRS